MTCVGAKRLSIPQEQLNLAMNGKQLLDKGSSKVQEPHGKWGFVFGTERGPSFLHELGEKRA